MQDDLMTREQLAALEGLAMRHGAIRCVRIDGTDDVYGYLDQLPGGRRDAETVPVPLADQRRYRINAAGKVTATEGRCTGWFDCDNWKPLDTDDCASCRRAQLRQRGVRDLRRAQ